MVPSIYPLETLHNSLSLKQVNEFLSSISEICGKSHDRATKELSAMFETMGNSQAAVDSYMPQQVLPSVTSLSIRPRSEKPPWYSSGPSSTVSSAGPSSPNTSDNSPRFSFSDKSSLTPQSSEEQQQQQSAQLAAPSHSHKDLQLTGQAQQAAQSQQPYQNHSSPQASASVTAQGQQAVEGLVET